VECPGPPRRPSCFHERLNRRKTAGRRRAAPALRVPALGSAPVGRFRGGRMVPRSPSPRARPEESGRWAARGPNPPLRSSPLLSLRVARSPPRSLPPPLHPAKRDSTRPAANVPALASSRVRVLPNSVLKRWMRNFDSANKVVSPTREAVEGQIGFSLLRLFRSPSAPSSAGKLRAQEPSFGLGACRMEIPFTRRRFPASPCNRGPLPCARS